jgi:hypothetical protein
VTRAIGRLIRRLLGVRSPSEWVPTGGGEAARWADIGASMIEGMQRGMELAEAERAALIASGMTPEEAQAVMLRDLVLNTDPVMLEYSRGVVMRSFPGIYDDEEGGEL